MYTLDALLGLVIKASLATIIGCVAYVYVKTIKDPNYNVKLLFWT